MRILFHGPGLAAFRPVAPIPHLLGVQHFSMTRVNELTVSHWLTGNRGNIIHAEAPAKIFRKHPTLSAYGNVAKLNESLGDAYADTIAENFDMIVISMANFIRPTNDGTKLFEALQRLDGKVPFIVLGAGLQGRHPLSAMQPGNADLIALFNERAAVFGVRGEETAEWLAKNGFSRATVLGCPSLYSYPQSIMKLDAAPARARAEAPRLMVAGHMSVRNNSVNPRGRDLARAFKDTEASYVLQDEFLTYPEMKTRAGFYNDGDARFDSGILNEYLSEKAGQKIAFRNYYYFNEAGAWRQAARSYDLYMGDRFHGGIAALQGGRPAIFLKQDNRVGELTSYFNLPALPIAELLKKGIAATITEQLAEDKISRMKATYAKRFAHFNRVMEAAGLKMAVTLPSVSAA